MKPQLSVHTIMAALERDLGKTAEWTSVAEGEESQVFGIRLDTDAFILRVNRSAEGFRKDAFCHHNFASSDLPVPQVVTIGEVSDGYAYCLSRRIPGTTLQELAAADLPAVVGPVVRVMKAIANAALHGTQGFGPFDANGMGSYLNWGDFITSIADERLYDWRAVESMINKKRIDKYLCLLVDLAPRCPRVRRLVHGDFGSNNILADRGRISGVIDWSEAMFGDPLYDVANIFFWRPWLYCMEAQARHIEERHLELTRNGEALRCYQLRIGLEEIYQGARSGNNQAVAWAMARCNEVLAGRPI